MKIEHISRITQQLHHVKSHISLSGETEYAVLIPLVEKDDKLFLLFEKRSKTVRQPGEICFPGGQMDATDTSLEEAALREMVEEIGIVKKAILPLGKLGVLYNGAMILHCFVGFIYEKDLPLTVFNPAEVEELLLVDLDELIKIKPSHYKIKLYADPTDVDEMGNVVTLFPGKELKLPERYHGRWHMGYRDIITYDLGEELIWGMTGKIVERFLMLFKGIN